MLPLFAGRAADIAATKASLGRASKLIIAKIMARLNGNCQPELSCPQPVPSGRLHTIRAETDLPREAQLF